MSRRSKRKDDYDRKSLREKRNDFRKHFRTYLVMSIFFIAINLATVGTVGWAIWPILGWGLGVGMQGLSLYGPLADPEEEHPQHDESGGTPLTDLRDESLELRELADNRPYRDEDLV